MRERDKTERKEEENYGKVEKPDLEGGKEKCYTSEQDTRDRTWRNCKQMGIWENEKMRCG